MYNHWIPNVATIGIGICLFLVLLDAIISRLMGGSSWKAFKYWWYK